MNKYVPTIGEYDACFESKLDDVLDKISSGQRLTSDEKRYLNSFSETGFTEDAPFEEQEDAEHAIIWDRNTDSQARLGLLSGVGEDPSMAQLTWSQLPEPVRLKIKNYLSDV